MRQAWKLESGDGKCHREKTPRTSAIWLGRGYHYSEELNEAAKVCAVSERKLNKLGLLHTECMT